MSKRLRTVERESIHLRLIAAVFGVLLAGTAFTISIEEPMEQFCTLEGRIDEPMARRDPAQGCNWVDEDGNLIPWNPA